MKNIKKSILIFAVLISGICISCNKWLDVSSKDEILEKDAFTQAKGFRSALLGVYKIAASNALWGQELTWGFKSAISWNYASGNAIPKYRGPLQYGTYDDARTMAILEGIWQKSYNAIANCNNLLNALAETDAQFEYSWEKDLITAEARGMRALLHFELLQLFRPAPVTGYTGENVALPYVTSYPEYEPKYVSMDEYISLVIEDLEYAQETLAPIDIDEMRNKSSFINGTIRMDDMNLVLFQGVGNIQPDGSKRDNAMSTGFFAKRGYRFNYWGATGLLARVYSYIRDFDKAEQYASIIIDDWVKQYQFNLYNTNPAASGSSINRIDGKRRPEPLIAFYNSLVCDNYATESGTSYSYMVNLSYLFGDDAETDYRLTGLYDASSKRYRVWNSIQDASVSANADVTKYSNPLLPVLELPEIYYIKAECQAQKGEIAEAMATLKKIRDARGCTQILSADNLETFMSYLVNDAQRDFLTRGTTWAFLKKFNWKTLYNGTGTGIEVEDSWYVLPIPDSEIAYI